ncbi:NAD(P)/FAD-dependent oxidoreductase [Microcoleus sp. FACHB-1515]|uniref:NAD(P)/FAD-dependent oxidoreductase n=1 Tax=Leptolyngbya sp. FACHB-1515 TaxID=2933931 RepID=UPI001685DF5D|nr:NAD(P)/FAD-dependent oxidoreductase [Microcoleus sp. FACHB-1515]MBD2089009.1 NAD(P)/FAD-dependent oxidoreductase [Microcoleus sp. FACHB-1515]
MLTVKIVVVGGGAAGYFAAIAAAENHPRAQVTLLEATRHPLSKVRVSGGGRCNVTHACFEPAAFVQNYPRGSKALRGAMTRFQAQDTVNWFGDRGVALKIEPDGRMFPTTDSSETIINCLTRFAFEAGVIVRTSAAVEVVERTTSGFELTLKSGELLKCDRLLLATGSSAIGHRLAQSLGHSIEPPVPSLFTFNILDSQLRELAGVAVETAQMKLLISNQKPLEQTGALLITHWGLSGPATLKLSAWGARFLHDQHYQATLQINWLPNDNPEKLRQELLAVKAQLPKRSIFANCPVMLPRRLWQYLITKLEIAPETRWSDLSKKQLNQLIELLTQSRYEIHGKGVFKEEFVTCGGVRLKEVDFKTMESRCCPGLFFAGEILDIDGVTGGFNFQSAWTTGWIAGRSIAAIEPALALQK